MQVLIAFFQLIRLRNLAIVAATQYLMRFAVIKPILSLSGFTLQFSEFDFAMLVVATVCLTAAGYAINDYFDTKTDLLNRPDTVVVGRKIARRHAMTIHLVLNTIGILAGFYAAYKVGIYQLGFIFVIVTGLLWYYSTSYKRQFLIGNLLVALLTAMVPIMVALFEIPMLNESYREILIKNFTNLNSIFLWVAGFGYFAFITTLAREIVKDIEDFEGDQAYGRNTLPIVLGINVTKHIVALVLLITGISVIYAWVNFVNDNFSLVYFVFALILPISFSIYKIYKAKTVAHYRFVAGFLKFIMLFGILYSVLVWYIINYSLL